MGIMEVLVLIPRTYEGAFALSTRPSHWASQAENLWAEGDWSTSQQPVSTTDSIAQTVCLYMLLLLSLLQALTVMLQAPRPLQNDHVDMLLDCKQCPMVVAAAMLLLWCCCCAPPPPPPPPHTHNSTTTHINQSISLHVSKR